jgi:uncharacterized damage-inducible protein DinB
MLELMRDLFGHQEWADAEMWRAVEAQPGALDDEHIGKRFRHFHATQHTYLSIVRGEQADIPSLIRRYGDSVSMKQVKEHAVETHGEWARFLSELTESRLQEKLHLSWFGDPPLIVTVTQALLQVAMHSQHHRGQNATRLRELDGKPPTLDFVLWIQKGKPRGEW